MLLNLLLVRLEDGRLLDYLVAHDELMEEKVAFFIRETLEALQHLHTCRVAHLDLKVGTIPVCATEIKTDLSFVFILNSVHLCLRNVSCYMLRLTFCNVSNILSFF